MITLTKQQATGYKELKTVSRVAEPKTRTGSTDVRTAIPHDKLVDAIKAGINAKGWQILRSQFTLSEDFCTIAGYFAVKGGDVPGSKDLTPCLGFMNTNGSRSKRGAVSLRFCTGGTWGEFGFVVDTFSVVDKHDFGVSSVESYLSNHSCSILSIEHWVGKRLEEESTKSRDHLLMEAGRAGIMPWSRIGRVDAVAREMGGTMLDLQLAFASVARMNPPHLQLEQMSKFAEIVDV